MRYMVRLIGVTLALALGLSACSSGAQAPPVATIAAAPLPADWQRVDVPQLEVAVPPDWAAMTAQESDPAAGAALAEQNPTLKPLVDRGMVELASGQLLVVAYDISGEQVDETGFATNLRIGQQTYPSAPSLADVSDVNEQELQSTASFSDVQRAPVSIGATPATRLTYKLQINDALGQPLTLALEQYLLVAGNNVVVITFTLPDGQQAAYRPTFDAILATLKLNS